MQINADYKLEQDTQRYTQIDAEEKQEIRGEEIEGSSATNLHESSRSREWDADEC
jgi:hypothetical protein